MAEAGTPESTMLSLMGHISRQMMEHYSHIRMTAKREAVESLSITMKTKTLPENHVNVSPNEGQAVIVQ